MTQLKPYTPDKANDNLAKLVTLYHAAVLGRIGVVAYR